MSHLLYRKRTAEPEGFDQAVSAFLAAGYHTASPPQRSAGSVSTTLKKEEEIWIMLHLDDGLDLGSTRLPTERLKTEIDAILARTVINEAPVI